MPHLQLQSVQDVPVLRADLDRAGGVGEDGTFPRGRHCADLSGAAGEHHYVQKQVRVALIF